MHSYSNREQWGYVQTSSNPADYASRGISPLKKNKVDLWLYGPPFLKVIDINSTNDCEVDENDPELSKKIKVSATNVEKVVYSLIHNIDSFRCFAADITKC